MNEERNLRKLKVDLPELEYAMESASWEHSYYLNLETGDILMVVEETRRLLEEICGDAGIAEFDEEEIDLESTLSNADLPEWQKNALRDANEVEEGLGTRYIAIPNADSNEAYDDMQGFIDTVQNQQLKQQLWNAIHGNHPFHQFKDVLATNPSERDRWFSFKNARLREQALDWLEEEGIELLGAE